MKIFKSSIIISLLYLCVIMLSCAAPENEENSENWNSIIKDLEIILASEIPDSVKAVKIKALFDTNQIALSDYRKFYEESFEKNPLKNLNYLKEIEQLISEDMKIESRRQKKIGKEIDYRSGKKENFKK